MDYDVSISIGTTANLGDLDKANKAVNDLAKAAGKVPDKLLSGGVGGVADAAVPAYNGIPSAGGASVRMEGSAELTESIRAVDKTINMSVRNVAANTGWLSRTVNTLASLPGKLQSAGGNAMQSFGKFNGGLQNLTNMMHLGKMAWDLGWGLGERLNEAFGVKVKEVDAKVAAALKSAQEKLSQWQDNLNAARAQHREDAFLKREAAGVKQVNDAYAARLRTIEAIDRKAVAGLEQQQKLLRIENEKNRSIIRERNSRGEISDAQARDMLAAIDAKDESERMDIERKQAKQAAATAQARADAAEERYNKLMALSQSGTARQAVTDLKPMDILNKADSLKRAEEDLTKWRVIQKRQHDAQKEMQEAIKDQARAATMAPLVGLPIALKRKQMEDQARQDYDAAVAAQHEFMRAKGMSFNQTDKGNEEGLKKIVEQRKKALSGMLDKIDKTGLVGDLSGMDDDGRLKEYLRILKLVKDVMANDAPQLEGIFTEMEDAKQTASEAMERLQMVTQEHQARTAANKVTATETAKTNARQDADKHAEVMAGAMEDTLRKQIEAARRKQETAKEQLDKARESLSANMDRIKDYASTYQGSKTGDKLQEVLDLYAKLANKPKWTKDEIGTAKKLDKWVLEINKESNLAGESKQYKEMAASILRVLEAWKAARVKESKIKKDDKAIRELERKAQDVSGLPGKLHGGQEKVLELDDWLTKMRRKVLGRSGEIANKEPIGALPDAEEMLKKVLSEQGDGGTTVTQGERKLLEHLKSRLENDDRRLEAGNEFNEMIGLIDQILNRYSSAQFTQGKLSGEVARLKARLDKIDSQGKFGPRN